MILLRTLSEVRERRESLWKNQKRLGFVPTMGALHEGHLELVRQAKKTSDEVWVSIFVNPLQFGPNEDLERYPRTFEKDCELLKSAGADAVFFPSPAEMTPPSATTFIEENTVSVPLCGALRPGHFKGVTTIVGKLFNLIQPHSAFFGEKDAQQVRVIERMVKDLLFPVEIKRVPTFRENDGLAMSSRNRYLSPDEREMAPELHTVLLKLETLWKTRPQITAQELETHGVQFLSHEPWKLQYLEVRDSESLERIEGPIQKEALIAVAAYLGNTRLIDNWVLKTS